MSLVELVDNTRTDKNTDHALLPVYDDLLINKKHTARNVLEVGIFKGGSIKLWRDYFPNATIHGIDIMEPNESWDDIKDDPNIILHSSTDAYNESFVVKLIASGTRFDFILDDGPHELEKLKRFVRLYSWLLAPDGILIIEDIQHMSWIDILKDELPENFRDNVFMYDVRHVKGRYDDVVFTVNMTKPTMTLEQMIDTTRSDKSNRHSYVGLYQNLLIDKKNTAQNILEIGICDGGSIKLWHDFFPLATIHGVDIIGDHMIWNELKDKPYFKIYASTDGYDPEFVEREFANKKFDMILDDGPHTLESMLSFIELYADLITDDGLLMIEDIQSWDWIEDLKDKVPEHLKPYMKAYDLRPNKGRYDDIVFTVDKRIVPGSG